MKYIQLTKEQFEELHEEFAIFLATQKIDESEWEKIKKENHKMADEELNIFSDLVWDKVLGKANYLDHFSKDSINLFKCGDNGIQRIFVKSKDKNINFLEENSFNWFIDNSMDRSVEYFKGQKDFTKERNLEIFDLIQQGSVVSDGKLFEAIFKMISK